MSTLRSSAYAGLATFAITLSFILWGRHADVLHHGGVNRGVVELWKNAVMPGLVVNQFFSVFGGQRESDVVGVNINSALVWALLVFLASLVILGSVSLVVKQARRPGVRS